MGQTGRREFLFSLIGAAMSVGLLEATPARAQEPPEQPPGEVGNAASGPSDSLNEPEPDPFNGVPPTLMSIPKLGVNASVVGVGQEADGTMAAPADPDTVGWYTLGPGMGIGGNAIFAGHVDWAGKYRVFAGLTSLNPGDAILIIDSESNGYEYRVDSVRWVRAQSAPIEEIFSQPDDAMITLITCGGDFNRAAREYVDRLIVTAKGA